jgi:hypothetical protein
MPASSWQASFFERRREASIDPCHRHAGMTVKKIKKDFSQKLAGMTEREREREREKLFKANDW